MKLLISSVHFIVNMLFFTGFSVFCVGTYYSLFVNPIEYFWWGMLFALVLIIGVVTEWRYMNAIFKIWEE